MSTAKTKRQRVAKDGGEQQPLLLVTAVKDALGAGVTQAIETLVKVGALIKASQETTEEKAAGVPDALKADIQQAIALLTKALAGGGQQPDQQTQKAAEGTTARKLEDAAAGLAQLSTQVAGAADAFDADAITKLRALAGALNAIAEANPQPTEKAEAEATIKQIIERANLSKDAIEKMYANASDRLAAVKAILAMPEADMQTYEAKEKAYRTICMLADVAAIEAVLNAPIVMKGDQPAAVEKAGRKMAQARLVQLRAAVDVLSKLLAEVSPEMAAAEGEQDDDDVAKRAAAKRALEGQPVHPAGEGTVIKPPGQQDGRVVDSTPDPQMADVLKQLAAVKAEQERAAEEAKKAAEQAKHLGEQNAQLAKQNDDLRQQVAKMGDQPEQPASRADDDPRPREQQVARKPQPYRAPTVL